MTERESRFVDRRSRIPDRQSLTLMDVDRSGPAIQSGDATRQQCGRGPWWKDRHGLPFVLNKSVVTAWPDAPPQWGLDNDLHRPLVAARVGK